MVAVALGTTYDNRLAAGSPLVFVKNLIVEKAITNFVDEKAYVTRPGVANYVQFPYEGFAGAFRGCFQQAGIGNLTGPGDVFVVFGNTLYQQNTATTFQVLGTIAGTDLVTFTASADQLLINGGGVCYLFSDSSNTFVTVSKPSAVFGYAWVAYLAGYFLLGCADSSSGYGYKSSQTIFFMPVDTSTGPDALDFFSVEISSGGVVRAMVLSDQVIFFGREVTEFWQASGDANLPFSRIVGQVYNRGIANKFAIAAQDNSIFWVGDDSSVYRASAVPQRISTTAIEEQIRLAGQAYLPAYSFNMDGHSYFILTIGAAGTFVYDVENQTWLSWSTGASPAWLIQYGTQAFNTQLLGGTPVSGQELYVVDGTQQTDLGQPITREIMGGLPIIGKPQRCDSFSVLVNSGSGASLDTDLEVDLRWSDTQGQSYSGWISMFAGVQGQYSQQPVARMLGRMRPPGRVFHIRCSTVGPFRISVARVNDMFAAPLIELPAILDETCTSFVGTEDGGSVLQEYS